MQPFLARNLTEQTIPRGDAGIRQTVARLVAAARSEFVLPIVRGWATRITHGCPPYGDQCRAYRILEFLRDRMRYTPDPHGVEAFGMPSFLLTQLQREGAIYGDCDDAAVLGAALAKSVGLPARLTVASFAPTGEFHHVWADAGLASLDWFQLDPFRSERFGGIPTREFHAEV